MRSSHRKRPRPAGRIALVVESLEGRRLMSADASAAGSALPWWSYEPLPADIKTFVSPVKAAASEVATTAGLVATPAVTLSDAGFESPSVGTGGYNDFAYDPSSTAWTYAGQAGVAGNGSGFTGNLAAPQGTQVGFVQNSGSIAQAITATAGTYSISFQSSQRTNYGGQQNFSVLVDGTSVGSFTPGAGYSSYTTGNFSLTAGSHTITFQGINSAGGDDTAFLDNVSVAQVTSSPTFSDAGFESPSVGTGGYNDFAYDPSSTAWTYAGQAGVAGNGSGFTGNLAAPQGTQVGFVQNSGSIAQAITATAGTYSISFQSSQRTNYGGQQNFSVLVDGTSVGSFTPGAGYSSYTTGNFSLTAGSHTITFQGINSAGGDDTAFLDNVSLTQFATPPFSPAQIRHAYGIDQLSETGAGQTIAIVDAYDNPTISTDLSSFDSRYSLAAPTFTKYVPNSGDNGYLVSGTTGATTPSYNSGWALEIALDVEWAHAVAPGATIMLVEAASDSYSDLLSAVAFATAHGAKQVSMSWGGDEFSGEAAMLDPYFDNPGVTYLASAGDSGAMVETPAADSYVTSVGGTTLTIDSAGDYLGESAWSGSGGGTATGISRPAYQNGFQTASGRGVPDVSYDANPNSGVYVVDGGSGYQVGGTSVGAPQWAGLIALANQGRSVAGKTSLGTGTLLGTNQILYTLAGGTSYTNPNGDFIDVTSGSDGNAAGPGYDLVTGLGSPQANKLIPDLVNS